MKPLYIFDLDGTLALIDHRRHFVECDRDKQDWKSFYKSCVNDSPNQPVIETLHALEESAEVWIFSGRSDEVREDTRDWLNDHCLWAPGHGRLLLMRKEGDFMPDDELKLKWLNQMSERDRARLVAVFDDRDKVVKMWRDNGVTCFQVAPGAF